MKAVIVQGRRVKLTADLVVGQGGEAVVYGFGPDRVLKIWKDPDHPDFENAPAAQAAVRVRLDEHQRKMVAFPAPLPARVAAPLDLALEGSTGQVIGFSMQRIRHAELAFRLAEQPYRAACSDPDLIGRTFSDLHQTVTSLHAAGVVIGDFNDTNVMVDPGGAWLIDVDSFQFDPFPCRLFTVRYLDPLLFDPDSVEPSLARPYSPASDWYAFAVMLMRSLLFVGPYGGVYRPRNPADRLPASHRPSRRITVFHPEVRYPKPALRPQVLPDDLTHFFVETFERDRRQPVPLSLLGDLRFTRCPGCGREHARSQCPSCTAITPASRVSRTAWRGDLVISQLWSGPGRIVAAGVLDGSLAWLSHAGGTFRREDERPVLRGPLGPDLRFFLRQGTTLVARRELLVALAGDRVIESWNLDQTPDGPACGCSGELLFRLENGRLLREGRAGPQVIGRVLAGLSRFWVGDEFGFGIYLAGRMQVAFLFEVCGHRFDDRVILPPVRGQLLDAWCCLASDRAWLFIRVQEQGASRIRCCCFDRRGQLLAEAEAAAGGPSWLGVMGGQCAVGPALFAPTDAGIVRIEVVGGQMQIGRIFAETEALVDQQCRLLGTSRGLAIISDDDIRLLRVA